MRILEVRDGFVKFEAEKNIALSSFIQINDTANSYIAQVLQVKRAGENSIAYAKILYLYNGAFNDYDKSLPAIDAEIIDFDYSQLCTSFKPDNAIIIGNFIENNQSISIEKDSFNKNLLMSIDTNETNKTIVKNLAGQFKNSIIIDTLGIFDTPKYVAGVDFKLPLNTDALEFMFEDCLNDATSDSKSLIKEIFQDLADYSKTVPFLPFGALKTIVDEMVDKSHVFKLLVLKNKLAKFDKLGYFAATSQEAENLNKILASKNAIIDLSKLDSTFLNRYLSIILSTLEKQNLSTQVFVEGSNTLDKKSLKKILTGKCATTFIAHSRFKYINEIKTMFKNFIVEPTFSNNEVFKKYAVLLKAMQKDTYLVIGEDTNSIPLISNLKEFTTEQEPEIIDIEDSTQELNETQLVELEKALEEEVEEKDSSIQAIDKKSEDLIEKVAEEVQIEAASTAMNIFEEEQDEISDNEEVLDNTEIVETESIQEQASDEELEEITELSESDLEEQIEEAPLIDSQEEYHTQVDEVQTIEIPEDISDLAEEVLEEEIDEANTAIEAEEIQPEIVNEPIQEISPEEQLQTILEVEEPQTIELKEYSEEDNNTTEIIPLTDELDEELDTIVELDESEISEADIIVDFEDEINEELSEEDLDKAIVQDVDKVFTTMKDDSISDSDLDFIDELNSEVEEEEDVIPLSEGMEELTELSEETEEEDSFLEPLEEVNDFVQEVAEEKEILETRNASTPIVPVYGADIPAEDMVLSDDIEQGDTVIHAKYGNGVVEKMIKYGTKTLYSINFDNVGRRLLDPTLTEIKKA